MRITLQTRWGVMASVFHAMATFREGAAWIFPVGGRDFTTQGNALMLSLSFGVGDWCRREQCLGVRVAWVLIKRFRGGHFHDPPEVHDAHLIGNMTDNGQIV